MTQKKNEINLIKKYFSIIWKILYQLLIVLCVLLVLIIVMQRVTNSNKSIKGLRLFRVISGSMVPQYDVGQVVICKDVDVSELKIGDTIVYRGNIGEFEGKIIMHNVVSIKTEENGETIIVTQGLYNTVGDPEIKSGQIYGKVVAKTQLLTLLYDLSNNIFTFFVIIVILVLNIFISWKKPEDIKRVFEEDNDDVEANIDHSQEDDNNDDYDDNDNDDNNDDNDVESDIDDNDNEDE